MARVLVTGGGGSFGVVCARTLVDLGWDVVAVDRRRAEVPGARFVEADLTDLGQVVEVMRSVDWKYSGGVDAVVHLGAIAAPGITTSSATFGNNIRATHNVFLAAQLTGVKRVVWASSETVLGIPFDVPPSQVPVDETVTEPQSSYALVKTLEEQMAVHFCRWDPELTMIGLRLSNIVHEAEYPEFSSFQQDPAQRRWNLWGYVDTRDAAQAVHLALTIERTGTDVYIIAAADTVMPQTSSELLAAEFPGVEVRGPLGDHTTLLSIDKARRELGYEPRHSWRDHFTEA